ncbi:hypothetical protein GE061_014072 [Apolygus lucorum]|uniref:Uncharacterized protein n=1 Tax=Apolygus lucorum TaxID=248454 RepID=A0A8S9XQU5_APOLU|nr:hypothetical protein GE061_014072 [Apolygus lucorum]
MQEFPLCFQFDDLLFGNPVTNFHSSIPMPVDPHKKGLKLFEISKQTLAANDQFPKHRRSLRTPSRLAYDNTVVFTVAKQH